MRFRLFRKQPAPSQSTDERFVSIMRSAHNEVPVDLDHWLEAASGDVVPRAVEPDATEALRLRLMEVLADPDASLAGTLPDPEGGVPWAELDAVGRYRRRVAAAKRLDPRLIPRAASAMSWVGACRIR